MFVSCKSPHLPLDKGQAVLVAAVLQWLYSRGRQQLLGRSSYWGIRTAVAMSQGKRAATGKQQPLGLALLNPSPGVTVELQPRFYSNRKQHYFAGQTRVGEVTQVPRTKGEINRKEKKECVK